MSIFFNRKRKKESLDASLSHVGRFVFLLDLVEVFIISLAIIIPIRFFLIQPFIVKGASMEPNFVNHDYLIVDQVTYQFKEPQRGDIVVFRYPRDPDQFFIKRIIGMPHEKVEVRDGSVFINGKILDESEYLPLGLKTSGEISLVLQADEYYLLGDNRGFSLDSRSFGALEESFIVGRVWLRGWPFNKIDVFTTEINLYEGDRLITN